MKKYIIFGAGCSGEEALAYYGFKNVAFFCDNNKQGKTIKGVAVIGFGEMTGIWLDYRVILATRNPVYRQEMQKMLEMQGITYDEFLGLEWKLQDDNFAGEYGFYNRSKSRGKLLMVLAGYKEFLWDSVFARIRGCVAEDMDVCVLTAGYENEALKEMCRRGRWSYLYTEENRLSVTQNITIRFYLAAG